MKLLYSPASPFARKVLVVAHETGLVNHIELVTVGASPIDPSAELLARNPLAKLPALVPDDGPPIYDSRVICEYLDAQAGGICFPRAGAARWTALTRQALADGLNDAAILIRYEHAFRPEEARSKQWIEGQFTKIRSALDALEREADELGPGVSIAEIAIGCALGYLDFRFASEHWRKTRPALATFFAAFNSRASMIATKPPPA